MNYVEFLRMRRNLSWFAGILGTLALIGMITINVNARHIRGVGNGHDSIDGGMTFIFGFGVAVTLIFATIIGGTLSRENETPEMIRTKPFPLERIAAGYILTDLAAILIAFAMACVLQLVVFLDFCLVAGIVPPPAYIDGSSLLILTLGLGVAFMWYGLVQAVSSGLRGRGGTVIGLSWAYFTILLGLSHLSILPYGLHELIVLLNVLDPLAYMNSITTHASSTAPNSIFPIDPWVRAAIVWTLGLAASAVAVFNWKRVEV